MHLGLTQHKQKGNILIYILLAGLIMVGMAGAYYLGTKKSATPIPNPNPVATSQTSQPTSVPITSASATPDETANWKTYKDPKGRFEFQYPAEFIEVPFKASAQFNKSGAILEGYTEDNLRLDEFLGRFEQYELVDNPGGFIFRFDIKKNQWMHSNGSISQFVPKKAGACILGGSAAVNQVSTSSILSYGVKNPKDFLGVEFNLCSNSLI